MGFGMNVNRSSQELVGLVERVIWIGQNGKNGLQERLDKTIYGSEKDWSNGSMGAVEISHGCLWEPEGMLVGAGNSS